MRIVPSAEAKRFENAATCAAFEYDTGDTGINVAHIEISGRYPLAGSAANTAVTELVYVESGSGTVTVDGVEHAIACGDVLSLEQYEHVA